MSEKAGIFVFGAKGHAKVVIDAIERNGAHAILFVCDDAPELRGSTLMGYPVIGGREDLLARNDAVCGIVAIGDNAARSQIARWLVVKGYRLAHVVHPAASIGRDVEIGDGTVVMGGCVINTGARVGRNVIVNTGATVDHDCDIGDSVHIGPGAHICGHVSVGEGVLIGAGATLIPSVSVGAHALVGAGSTVLTDIPEGTRVGGSPCRPLAK